jgi:hypothetical protein
LQDQLVGAQEGVSHGGHRVVSTIGVDQHQPPVAIAAGGDDVGRGGEHFRHRRNIGGAGDAFKKRRFGGRSGRRL